MSNDLWVHQDKSPKTHPLAWVFIGAAVILFVACGVGLVGYATTRDDEPNRAVSAADRPTTAAPTPTKTTPPPATLATGDVELTVKTKSKQCFGSAGCLVEWEIRAAWPETKVPTGAECDVTYDVRGLDQTQTATLVIRDDGKYTQDSFTSGNTERESSKLSARVTEVECR